MRSSGLHQVKLACEAMKTRFEVILIDDKGNDLHALGEELLQEVRDLDRQLNCFSGSSELAFLNANAARKAVRVEPRLFELLVRCRGLWEVTEGAFDPTVGALMEVWGGFSPDPRRPSEQEIADLRGDLGMDKVDFDFASRTVRFQNKKVWLNLSAVGKGYALDRCAEILEEHGIRHALLHGGTSSVRAFGSTPEGGPWRIGIASPRGDGKAVLCTAHLEDLSLGVSAGRILATPGGSEGVNHIIDPMSGRPREGRGLVAVTASSAADTDALSTALMAGRVPLAALSERLDSFVVYTDGDKGDEPDSLGGEAFQL